MIDNLRCLLSQHNLLNNNYRFLLMVSGGSDSICLLEVFSRLFPVKTLAVMHINYSLRGIESDLDAKFVQDITQAKNMLFFYKKVIINKKDSNLQQKAREIRYSYANTILKKHDFHYIVSGHHFNDLLETFFLKLF